MNTLKLIIVLGLLLLTELGRADPFDTWSQQRLDEPPSNLPASINDLNSITYANGQFVTVGESGIILPSPDGISWTQRRSGTTNRLSGIAFGKGKFVAVGSFSLHFDDKTGGTILTSADGVDWIQT